MKLNLFAIPVFSLSLAACGSDPLTQDEIDRAWPTTSTALSTGAGSTSALTQAPWDLGFSTTVACEDGGSVKLTLNVSAEDLIDFQADEFSFDAEAQDCQADGLTMNGEVAYSLGITTSETETTLEWGWDGELSYEGTLEGCEGECGVNGDCEFELTGSLTASDPDATGNPTSFELEYSGTVCGHEAGAWLNVDTSEE
jgi:hypothetical protein